MKRTIAIFNLIVLFFLLTSCGPSTSYSKSFFAMDTLIDVTIYNAEEKHLNEIQKIYMNYSNACDMFNSYEGNLCDLNERRTIEVDEYLLDVIEYSLTIQKDLNGYFNILIGRLTKIWKDALHIGEDTTEVYVPELELIQNELEIMNNSSIKIEGNKVSIIGDANIDLGGVAKGYATQKVEEYLEENNIKSYLINAGSSNIALGYKNKKDTFIIGLKKVYGGLYKKIKIANKAIVTSSLAEQHRVIDGKMYTHIINPLTGYSENRYDIITLIGEESGYLDILSTTLYSMDLEDIKRVLEDKNIDIIIVKDNEIMYSSEGVNQYEEV